MIFYQVVNTNTEHLNVLGYFPTLDAAKSCCKWLESGVLHLRGIVQVDVSPDKHTLLALLTLAAFGADASANLSINDPGTGYLWDGLECVPSIQETGQCWRFSPRGGLITCTKEEL